MSRRDSNSPLWRGTETIQNNGDLLSLMLSLPPKQTEDLGMCHFSPGLLITVDFDVFPFLGFPGGSVHFFLHLGHSDFLEVILC